MYKISSHSLHKPSYVVFQKISLNQIPQYDTNYTLSVYTSLLITYLILRLLAFICLLLDSQINIKVDKNIIFNIAENPKPKFELIYLLSF